MEICGSMDEGGERRSLMLLSKKYARKKTIICLPSLLRCSWETREDLEQHWPLNCQWDEKAKVLRRRGLGEYLQEDERHRLCSSLRR